MSFKKLLYSLYEAIVEVINHDGVEHAGYMSFMVLFSIFPFFVFILAFTSFFGASDLGKDFIHLVMENLPKDSVESIKIRVEEITTTPPQSLLTLAVLGSIWTASSFLECLRTILNRIYRVSSPPPYLFRRLLSIIQFLCIIIIISIVMFLLIIIPIGLERLPTLVKLIEEHARTINAIRYYVLFAFLFGVISILYYMIPNTKLTLFEVSPGAMLCTFLWSISGHLLSQYIRYYHQLNLIYGSLGSIIITMLFFFIVNMLFIYGAEFNYLLFRKN